MRKDLRWTLAGTLLLSAAAVWWPQKAQRVVAAADVAPGSDALGAGPSKFSEPLPGGLEPMLLEPARRDPFAAVSSTSQAVAPPPPKPAAPVVVPLDPTSPAAPPLTLRYLGRMVTPDGRPMVLLARGDVAVTVQPGMMLDEGYRVLRITPGAVRLVYPPTGGEVDIPIPPAPPSP